MQYSPFPQFCRRQRGERRLHQAALVVALLRPRVGKEEMDRRKRAVGNHVLEHVERIVADDADIGEPLSVDGVQQAADARPMHFHRDEVDLGVRLGDLDGGFAHSRADLEHELPGGRNFPVGEGNAVLGKQRLKRPCLRRGCPALPQDVAADRPVQAAFGAIFPSVGELGAAA
jgi:hypothetical protein